jgi:divalent metal cation (Fe/Co/Zn/Cd) transporter
LLFPVIGSKVGVWWLDPVGAAVLSLYIVYDWGATLFSNVIKLSGTAADDRLLRKLTYMAYRFSPIVEGFKSLVAYHAGDGVWAEIDVLLDGNEKLMGAHDVAETMQYCFEGMSDVDRAFVSMDCKSRFSLSFSLSRSFAWGIGAGFGWPAGRPAWPDGYDLVA